MHGVGHGDADAIKVQRAALAETHDLDPVFFGPELRDLVDAEHRNAALPRDRQRGRGMVAMAVGQADMRRPRGCLCRPILGKGGIARQPGVDQQDLAADLDAKAAMAQPDDLHVALPWFGVAGRITRQGDVTTAGCSPWT